MAQYLYPGCDVWLNNPLRPFEACGTSGMKAALNGGLNLSILDGWWDEWFDGENGWAIPTADGVEDAERRDDIEAAALYDLIENSVAPRFYDVDAEGLPQNWISMITHTLATLGPKVLASRMVRDYTTQLYGPAARAGWSLNGETFAGARDLAAYKTKVKAAWPSVQVDHVESSGVGDSPEIGETLHVRAYVSLGDLSPDEVDVQVVLRHGTRLRRAARRAQRVAAATSRPTRVVATSSRVTSRWPAPARSATPSACCPSTPAWPAPASSAWSPTPEAAPAHQPGRQPTAARYAACGRPHAAYLCPGVGVAAAVSGP